MSDRRDEDRYRRPRSRDRRSRSRDRDYRSDRYERADRDKYRGESYKEDRYRDNRDRSRDRDALKHNNTRQETSYSLIDDRVSTASASNSVAPARRRVRPCGWDNLDAIVDTPAPDSQQQLLLAQHQQLLMLQQQQAGNKKAREIYVGNLPVGHSSVSALKDHFNQIFSSLPEYNDKYQSMKQFGAVRDVKLSACGMFGFIEFWTEELAVTALELDKHDFFGRPMKVGRPTGFTLSHTPPPPLDLSALKRHAPSRSNAPEKKSRELYVGNLPVGAISADLLRELFEPACLVLPDYQPHLGPPVIHVELQGEGRFAFVEFQNEGICNAALQIFNGMDVLGRRITVGRPQGYAAMLTQQPLHLQPVSYVEQQTPAFALGPSQATLAALGVGPRLTSAQLTAALTGRRT